MAELPPVVARYAAEFGMTDLEELRLHPNSPVLARSARMGTVCGKTVSQAEFSKVIDEICEHSLHAHFDTINEGYISYKGLRVGICGRAVTSPGRGIIGVRDFSGLCFRVPGIHKGCAGAAVAEFLTARCGMLFYSPPGGGKTTVLRDMMCTLSSPPHDLRVSAVDTRGELAYGCENRSRTLDLFSGYPKAKGMEIALRCFAPQVIVCDEIGASEAQALLFSASCGVPILASAHADTLAQLLSSPPIAKLHEAGIFGCYAAIRRRNQRIVFTFTARDALAEVPC
ncbi:MAG: hypothetical protein E7616_08730 [Ruminococcaceae bacterium]|nr:hypothetical protein [Oscillospiraceae bacterium]